MKITTTQLEDHHVKLAVEIEPDTLSEAKRRAARKLSQRVRIPGFRPGKAPYQVIVRQLGEGPILEEAIEQLANDIYPKAIEESGIKPYGPGALDQISSWEPVILEFKVPLQAEVKLGDYHSIRHPYNLEQVSEDEINRVIQNLQERNAILEPVNRPAQEGDLVSIRLSAERIDTEPSQEKNILKDHSIQVLISDEANIKQDEWPYPGFSRNLIGLSSGDTKTIEFTFPESTQFDALKGAQTIFSLKVEEVKSRTLPELDDEFASTLGDFSSLEELKSAIRQELENQKRETYNREYDEVIVQELISKSSFQYPSSMLEHEIDDVIHNLEHRLEEQKLDLDLYLKSRNMDKQALRDEMKPIALQRLKRSMLLSELAIAENIQVDPNQLQQETLRTVNILSQSLPEKEAKRLSNKDVMNNLVGNVMLDLLTQKTLARFREITSQPEIVPGNQENDNLKIETLIEEPAQDKTGNELPESNSTE